MDGRIDVYKGQPLQKTNTPRFGPNIDWQFLFTEKG
jgi:hypothetical protein